MSKLVLLCALSGLAADVGPKPTLSGELVYPKGLEVVSASLTDCSDQHCADERPFRFLGPQRFEYDATKVFAMAYSFAPWHRLKVTFKDGDRLSVPFETPQEVLDLRLEFRVEGDALRVAVKSAETFAERLDRDSKGQSRARRADEGVERSLGWMLDIAEFIGKGGAPRYPHSWVRLVVALMITLTAESMLAAWLMRRDSKRQAAITIVALGSILTLPLVVWAPLYWIPAEFMPRWPFVAILIALEVVAFAIEGMMLARFAHLDLRRALGLSLVVNGTSFAIGLLLPI